MNRSAAIAEKTCLEIIMMMMVFSLRKIVVDQNQDEDDPYEQEDQSAGHLTCEICNFILEKCSATPRTA